MHMQRPFGLLQGYFGFSKLVVDFVGGMGKIMCKMFFCRPFCFFTLTGWQIGLNNIDHSHRIRHALTGKKITACNIILMYAVQSESFWTMGNRIICCNACPHFPVLPIMNRIESPQLFINRSFYHHGGNLHQLGTCNFNQPVLKDTGLLQ